VWIRNSNLLLTNSGTISGSRHGFSNNQFDSLVAGDTTVRVNNSGTIEGGDRGINTNGVTTDYEHYLEVVNSGTISGGLASFGVPAGLAQGQTNDTLQNSGEMLGDVRLGNGNDVLFNSGTILGDIHKLSGTLSLTNTGLIDGNLDVSGATLGSLVIANTGTITGDVAIAPQGSFDGRGGTVLGSINGSTWDDTILLGDRDSTASGNTGNDLIGGGAGDDSLSGGADADTLKGAQGEDTLLGEDGDDVLRGQDGSDSIDGGADNDSLQGGSGDDTMIGDAGFDTLYGNGGDDLMEGGGRSDLMVGGKGNDTMTGGGGGDTFVIRRVGNGDDEVTDFRNGLDVVDISALGVQNFNALNNTFGALSEDTDGVLIDLQAAGGSGSVRLVGVTLADMDASDFIF
jgi:Ca2+-binding RTX toxin-like protein